MDSEASRAIAWAVDYGTWRDTAKLAKLGLDGAESVGADTVAPSGDLLTFVHHDGDTRRETDLARGQNVPPDAMPGVLAGRNFGGVVLARGGLTFAPSEPVAWQAWTGRMWPAKTIAAKTHALAVALGAAKGAEPARWESGARALLLPENRIAADKAESRRWNEFWNRSFVFVSPGGEADDPAFQVGRNYQLFRQMLACNEGGEFPLKFNGGIFTVDPYPDRVPPRLNNPSLEVAPKGGATPDFRRWGQMFMSQNQRWLGWPSLVTGDARLLAPSSAFYRARLAVARARAKNLKAQGACYPEPLGLEGTVCVSGPPPKDCAALPI